jgi:hypothetical protein
MKLCKDCKYYKRSTFAGIFPMNPAELSKCVSPAIPRDMVIGEIKTAYAELERKYGTDCGPDARYFEQGKPTLWQRVKQMMIS